MKSTRRNTLWLLCDHSEWCIWNRACTAGWRLWEWEWKLPHPIPTQQSLKSLPCLHGRWVILQSGKLQLQSSMQSHYLTDTATTASYSPALMRPSEQHSPHSSADARSPTPMEADVSSSVQHSLCHCIMSTRDQFLTKVWDDDDDTTPFDEHFPTAPFSDDVWAEEQIPDRCLCIHERPDDLNHWCSYPCPYDSTIFSMDFL